MQDDASDARRFFTERRWTVRVRQRAPKERPTRRFLVQVDSLLVEGAVVWSRLRSFRARQARRRSGERIGKALVFAARAFTDAAGAEPASQRSGCLDGHALANERAERLP